MEPLNPSSRQGVSIPEAYEMSVNLATGMYDSPEHLSSVIPYVTLRVRQPQGSIEEQARTIANFLRQNDKLIRDDPSSALFRTKTLRAMAQSLAVKKSVKLELQDTVDRRSKETPISRWKWFKYRTTLTFKRMIANIRDMLRSVQLWQNTIKSIVGHFGSGIATYFIFLRQLVILNVIVCILSTFLIALPQALDSPSAVSNVSVFDFVTGSGFFTDTIMYYGFYGNGTVEKIINYHYNIPSAYFLTTVCCYIFTFVVLSVEVAQSYRKCYVETSGNVRNFYTNKIFCGWDFNISSAKVANLWSATLYRELKETLAEQEKSSDSDFLVKFRKMTIRFGVTIICLLMTAGTAVLLWKLLNDYGIEETGTLSIMTVPVMVTIIMNIFPAIVSCLARCEKYASERTALYTSVIRIHILAATIIGTLLLFWLTEGTTGCWQTKLGKEIYRLILVDLIISILGNYLLEAIYFILRKKVSCGFSDLRFDVASNASNLTYNQTLFWLAFYFSPPMSLIISVKMLLMFCIKSHGLFKYRAPPSKPWRAAQTQTLFMALAFLGMICTLATLSYVITSIPCDNCGPFRNYNYTMEFFVQGLLRLDADDTFSQILRILVRPVTGAAILISMCVGVYCLRAKVEASKETLRILREMLLLQSQDKEFLLKEYSTLVEAKQGGEEHVNSPGVRRRNPSTLL